MRDADSELDIAYKDVDPPFFSASLTFEDSMRTVVMIDVEHEMEYLPALQTTHLVLAMIHRYQALCRV